MSAPLPVERPAASRSILLNEKDFELAQRSGKVLGMSAMFPAHLKDPNNDQITIANAMLVIDMAARMNEHPLMISQSIYFVSGRPGWDAKFMIAKANVAGVFRGRVRWREKGGGDSLEVTAYATLKDTGDEVTAEASMAMAKAEGWTKNPKYKSMPKQMLRYRSVTFLVRLYCPEVLLGLPTSDEVEDINYAVRDITPGPEEAAPVADAALDPVEEAEIIEQPTQRGKKASPGPAAESREDGPGEDCEEDAELTPEVASLVKSFVNSI
ncbi:MAG: recombinase RecT, partial [Pseudomonadota bacterium]